MLYSTAEELSDTSNVSGSVRSYRSQPISILVPGGKRRPRAEFHLKKARPGSTRNFQPGRASEAIRVPSFQATVTVQLPGSSDSPLFDSERSIGLSPFPDASSRRIGALPSITAVTVGQRQFCRSVDTGKRYQISPFSCSGLAVRQSFTLSALRGVEKSLDKSLPLGKRAMRGNLGFLSYVFSMSSLLRRVPSARLPGTPSRARGISQHAEPTPAVGAASRGPSSP